MVRTTTVAVQGILGSDYDSRRSPDLSPRIETAATLVDDILAKATELGIPLTDTRLEVIERWLAAHLYCVTDRPYKSRSAGGASGTFDGNTDKGLDATLYGQTAKVLDTTGFLSSIGGGGGTGTGGGGSTRAGLFWAGDGNQD
jgi:hypothetical protein